jgi:hypothetical protein
MAQLTADGRVSSVKMFDDDMRAEVKLNTLGGQVLTLKLTDNQQSAFSGMVALACGSISIGAIPFPVHVTYDDDDREINDLEIRT